jgi:hypothetical protein
MTACIMPEIHKELALSGMNNENLHGVTSKATILARCVWNLGILHQKREMVVDEIHGKER